MKLGIIGNGKIVHEALYAIEPLKNIRVTAIYARSQSKAKADEIAKEYGIKEVYTNYDEFLKNSNLDTVYIGLANHVHFCMPKKHY